MACFGFRFKDYIYIDKGLEIEGELHPSICKDWGS